MVEHDGILHITKGDDIYFTIDIIQIDGTEYAIQDKDVLYFSMEKNCSQQKNSTLDDYNLYLYGTFQGTTLMTFSRVETDTLMPGKYMYEVILKKYTGTEEGEDKYVITTLIPTSPAIVHDRLRTNSELLS